jgi:hypothetical protein
LGIEGKKTRAKVVEEVMETLKVDADAANLGAMLVKGYITKSKGSYLECAQCHEKICRESKCLCEET